MTNLATKLNRRSAALCRNIVDSAGWLDVGVSEVGQVRVLDFGSSHSGQLESGVQLSRICMADLAQVSIGRSALLGLPSVNVVTDHPLWACMAGQYAGWPFHVGDYFAMGSGPARMARGEEELLDEYGLLGEVDEVVGVFETSVLPGSEMCLAFLDSCAAESGYFCVARTASLPGAIQIVARSIETTLHKLHELKFDLRKVKNAIGSAPLPPVAADDFTALGWTNDSILYGADVTLWVDAPDEELKGLAESVPSCSSSEFGRPFVEIFEDSGRDFYKIDKMLFSPARVSFQSLRSGVVATGGEVRADILARSFGFPDCDRS